LAGHVIQNGTAVQNSNPYDKRIGAFQDALADGRKVWRSIPWTLPIGAESKPYQKLFGMFDPWSLERQELFGITPDGLPGDLLMEKLGLR
jgi:hypothetical protein